MIARSFFWFVNDHCVTSGSHDASEAQQEISTQRQTPLVFKTFSKVQNCEVFYISPKCWGFFWDGEKMIIFAPT